MRRAIEALRYKLFNRKWKFLDVVHLLMLGVSVVIFVNVTVRLNMLHQERVAYKNMYDTLRMVKDMDQPQNPAGGDPPGETPPDGEEAFMQPPGVEEELAEGVEGEQPPQEGFGEGEQPPATEEGEQPSPPVVEGEAGGEIPAGVEGEVQPPVVEGEVPPPVVEGEVPPPVVEGEGPPPVVEGEVPTPVVEGEVSPPAVEGEVPPPAVEGEVPPAPVEGEIPVIEEIPPPVAEGEAPPALEGEVLPAAGEVPPPAAAPEGGEQAPIAASAGIAGEVPLAIEVPAVAIDAAPAPAVEGAVPAPATGEAAVPAPALEGAAPAAASIPSLGVQISPVGVAGVGSVEPAAPIAADPGYGVLSPAVGTSGENLLPLNDTLKNAHDARGNNLVILSYVDNDFLEMAHNFYETSIVPFGLQDNLVFVAASQEICAPLRAQGANCYIHTINPTRTEELQVLEYRRKLRGEAVLAALQSNLTILNTHVDVFFLKNPLPELVCDGCDVQTFNDVTTGDRITLDFVWLKPTTNSLNIWKTFKETSLRDITGPSVDTFNRALRQFKPYSVTRILDPTKFMPGIHYFETLNHTFAGDNPCEPCTVVHNNWIVTRAAKIYRLKENHLWNYDKDGYYTNPAAKYIVYDNPVMFGNETNQQEIDAFKSALALGRILDRIVILPKFHCGTNMCGLNSVLSVASLDSVFKCKYREHTFLDHTKVPAHIKSNQTNILWIDAGVLGDLAGNLTGTLPITIPTDAGEASDDTIRSLFESYKDIPVLRFHSLYGVYKKFLQKNPEFESDAEKGLVADVYRQHKTSWRL